MARIVILGDNDYIGEKFCRDGNTETYSVDKTTLRHIRAIAESDRAEQNTPPRSFDGRVLFRNPVTGASAFLTPEQIEGEKEQYGLSVFL